MEILNSGSFITLDNRDKIEQLIHTANELANAASQTPGFMYAGGSTQQLAIECWQGAEYVTRAHEEATIKNIFLSNFLKHLAGLDRARKALPVTTPTSSVVTQPGPSYVEPVQAPPELPSESTVTADEYLGVISGNEDADIDGEKSSYADECIPEGEREITEYSAESDTVEKATLIEPEPVEPNTKVLETEATVTQPKSASEQVEPVASEQSQDPVPESASTPTVVMPAVESIVLVDKEPYNFDSSTITAVVQLLPIMGQLRKCVISVRSHDFTPQVTIAELPNPLRIDDLTRELNNGFTQYQADLPARSADKLKKEKSSTKKRTAKPAEKAKSEVQSPAASSAGIPPATVPSTDQANLFAS